MSGTETLRTDFIANVSHELKTPLAIIQNYETMLQQPGLSEEKRLEYAKSVTDASRRLANLITNILKLNKLENQQIYPATEEYDLSEQLCISLLQFENIWEQKGIDIDTDIEDGITVQADASSDSYQHCFSNWRFPNGMGCNTHCLCSLYIIFLYPFGNNDFVYKSLSRML